MDVLIDLSYGDAGKGRMIDYLMNHYDMVCRFNGGSNSGHVVVYQGVKHTFHILPSGILHKKICIIGNGCVVNPISLMTELLETKDKVDFNPLDYIILSDKAHLITPCEIMMDKIKDEVQGIGTTKSGNGVAYARKASREGFRVSDLFLKDDDGEYTFEDKYRLYFEDVYKSKYFDGLSNEKFFEAVNFIRENISVKKTEYIINDAIKDGKKIICEGAQGTLLEIDFGTYPYVTSSSTISASACIGLGVSPKQIDKVYGVTKCYTTRVGNGEFETELGGELSAMLVELGGEYGSTTGRKRRVGWLNLKELQYAIMLNGVTDMCITKFDILSHFETFSVMNLNGVMVVFESWGDCNFTSWDDAPKTFKDFIIYLETELDVNVSYMSIGRDRNQLITK